MGVGLLLALLVVVFSSVRVLAGVFDLWQTQDAFSHGWVILAMVVYLLWLQRHKIAADRLQPCWLALGPIACIGLLQSSGIANLEMFLLPSLLLSVVVLLVGPRAALKYGFPLLLLHAALPGWGPALPVLHKMTVFVVEQMLAVTSITAYFDGAEVNIPSGRFIIEDGCSGMNYFIVGSTIAAIYAYLGPRSWRLAGISMALGISLAILANWLRVYGVILIGHYTDMQSPIVNNHGTFGWFVFAGAMLLFYFVMTRLFPDDKFLTRAPTDQAVGSEHFDVSPTGSGMAVGLVITSLVLTMQIGNLANWLLTDARPLAPLVLPADGVPLAQSSTWQPQIRGATESSTTKVNGVTLNVARFDRQDSPALVQDDEVWADGSAWRLLDWRIQNLPTASIQRLDLRSGTEQVLVWTWYGVDDYQGASRTMTRLRQAASRYIGSGTGYLVSLWVTCGNSDCVEGEAALADFMQATGPRLMTNIAKSMHASTGQESS